MGCPNINDVRLFWESHPLFEGESNFDLGTIEYFEEHKRTVIDDCMGGSFDVRLLPPERNRQKVLDLGCGPGFWTVELAMRGCAQITAVDLTRKALELTQKRCEICGVKVELSQQNAESLTFKDNTFSHVNCQGVIHHTPDTQRCLEQIARVLKKEGTACISVYYRNFILRTWPWLKHLIRPLAHIAGVKMRGRGREAIFFTDDIDEVVRLFDGADNPIGKAYSKDKFIEILSPYFRINDIFLHFFPARILPFSIPKSIHRFMDRHFGFMMYAIVEKTSVSDRKTSN